MPSHRPPDQPLINIWDGYHSQSSEDGHNNTGAVDDPIHAAVPALAAIDLMSDNIIPLYMDDYGDFNWEPLPTLEPPASYPTTLPLSAPGITFSPTPTALGNGQMP